MIYKAMGTRKLSLALVLSSCIVGLHAQNKPAEPADDPVLLRVDGVPVTRSEFEAIYKKNNKDAPVTREALDEYLELFINYKLKVREAEMLGMDTIAKFRTELSGYREQLARPYLIDRELNDNLMQEAFERMQEEVRAAHILVQVAPEASPEDTLAAWKRIQRLRERVMAGEDFATVAMGKLGSDDPSVQRNGGDLGWFSALQMVYPFETAAYGTPVGKVSEPVRTRFGYHIIKVSGKRPARGQIRAAHVMLRSTAQDSPDRKAEVERRIREIHAQLKEGKISFADAALRYSEDDGTSSRGGELPQFSTGKMVEEFEDAAFGIPEDGAISEPFQTAFGWHIVKRLSYEPPPTFDQAKADLRNRISRDSRAEITRRAFLDRLKRDYGFKAFDANVRALLPLLDTSIFKKGTAENDTLLRANVTEGAFTRKGVRYRREITGTMRDGALVSVRSKRHEEIEVSPKDTVVVRDIMEGWSYDRKQSARLVKPVFSLDGRTYTQADLLDDLERKQRRERSIPLREYLEGRFNEMVDETVLAYENDRLEEKYADFRLLMKEYRDGILLFELTDQKVWSRAVKDSSGLEAFHQANADAHRWPQRYEADLYSCADAKVAKRVRKLLRKGTRGADLVQAVNQGSALALSIDQGLFTLEEKPYLAGATQPGLSDNIAVDGRVVIVDLKRIIPAGPKSLDEARGLVTAAYQDHLEREWIKDLRAKYPVQVERQVLYSIR